MSNNSSSRTKVLMIMLVFSLFTHLLFTVIPDGYYVIISGGFAISLTILWGISDSKDKKHNLKSNSNTKQIE